MRSISFKTILTVAVGVLMLGGAAGPAASQAPAGAFNFTRDLHLGARGADVTALQEYLKTTGHFPADRAATGFFGEITRRAVAAWQTANGISPANGYFGALSRARYNQLIGGAVVQTPAPARTPAPPLPAGAFNFTRDLHLNLRGDDVAALQEYLKTTGHFPVEQISTGVFGELTRRAVAGWQVANDISPANGYFGAISRAKYSQLMREALAPTPTPRVTPRVRPRVTPTPTPIPVEEPITTPFEPFPSPSPVPPEQQLNICPCPECHWPYIRFVIGPCPEPTPTPTPDPRLAPPPGGNDLVVP